MKRLTAIILAILMLAACLVACGEDNKDGNNSATEASVSETKPVETTVVMEFTPEGNTIEKDAEGNTIERSMSGKIVSVTDKDGNTVSVTEYSKAHPDIANPQGSSQSSGSGEKTDTPSKTGDGDKTEAPQATEDEDVPVEERPKKEVVEEEIPQVIVEIPDADDAYELPPV